MADQVAPPLFELKDGADPIEPYYHLSNDELLQRFRTSLKQVGLTKAELSDPKVVDAALQDYVNTHLNSDKDTETRPPWAIAIVNGKELGETYSLSGIVACLYMHRNVLEGVEVKEEHAGPLTVALYSLLVYARNRVEAWVCETP